MGRPKSYERTEVLDRAMRLFWAKGYEGTHLSELVDATGLNRFSLYNEFGGKEGLYRASLEHYIESLGGLFALLQREPLGLANIRAFHRAQLVDEYQDGCFALNTIREKSVVPAVAWSTVQGFTAATRAGLLSNLRAAAAGGELPPDRDPETIASILSAFDIGLLSFRSLGATPDVALTLIEELERRLFE